MHNLISFSVECKLHIVYSDLPIRWLFQSLHTVEVQLKSRLLTAQFGHDDTRFKSLGLVTRWECIFVYTYILYIMPVLFSISSSLLSFIALPPLSSSFLFRPTSCGFEIFRVSVGKLLHRFPAVILD